MPTRGGLREQLRPTTPPTPGPPSPPARERRPALDADSGARPASRRADRARCPPRSPDATAVGPWGRVDDDGTVFVRTADGERQVGQWPGGDPAEALALFTRKYDALVVRGRPARAAGQGRARSPPRTPARRSSRSVRRSTEAQVVGDLDALDARLEALAPLVAEQREKRKAERAEKLARRTAEKERIAAEAETAGRRQRLARRRRPAARAARRVEGAAPAGEVRRRRAVAAVLLRPHDVHPAPQGALRRAQREARGRPRGEGEAGQGGRGAVGVDRVGSDRGRLPRADAPLEGGRPGPQGRRRPALEAVPRRAGHLLRRARRGDGRGTDAEFAENADEEGGAARRGRGAAAGHRPAPPRRPRSATSPTGGTPPARCRASG